jgi:hypothetical protein
LATTHPDSFLPNLARSLSNLGSMLRDLRRHQDALAATAEAVRIGRHLVAARPDAFLHELAGTLSNLSVMLNDNGRCEDAFPPAHEAARHYRSLAAGRPDAFLPHLALSLSNMSAVLKGLSRLEDAFDAAEEAVRITIPFTRAHRHAFEKRLRQCSAILETCLTDLGHEPSSSSTLSIARQILATFEGSSDPSA